MPPNSCCKGGHFYSGKNSLATICLGKEITLLQRTQTFFYKLTVVEKVIKKKETLNYEIPICCFVLALSFYLKTVHVKICQNAIQNDEHTRIILNPLFEQKSLYFSFLFLNIYSLLWQLPSPIPFCPSCSPGEIQYP